jgi:pyrroloquinoline quinone (PQQ) biosynthesis protein C
MSFFITLVESSDASRRAIETAPRVHAMIHKGLTLAEYRAFLRDLYHVVWHFCPIMAAAAARCGDSLRAIRYDLYHRIEEEKGHEDWVAEDIAALGGDAKPDIAAVGRAAKAAAPSAPVQAMIGYNYYAADRIHPCSVLGMLYVLEVVASVYGGKAADSIARAIGRDPGKGGFRFLSSHATMDADHLAQLNVLLKTIDDPAAQAAVISSAQVNFHQFGQLFSDAGFVSHLAA